MLRTVHAMRYITPLREGGSLPAVVEADDGRTYVLKFRGAGQGPKALIAELVAGEIGRTLGLPVPEIVLIGLDPIMGRSEPDAEIQDLLKASAGLNLGLAFLPGALAFDPVVPPAPDPYLSSCVVWFDAYMTNVDRSAQNTNILVWRKHLWLIDHGAALYFHHSWSNYLQRSRDPFALIKRHVLLPFASALDEANRSLSGLLSPAVLGSIIGAIPGSWLRGDSAFCSEEEYRSAYLAYLTSRLEASKTFVQEAQRARAVLV